MPLRRLCVSRRSRVGLSGSVRFLYWIHRNAFYVILTLYVLLLIFVFVAVWFWRVIALKDILIPIATATGLFGAALSLLHQQRTSSARVYDELMDRFERAWMRNIIEAVERDIRKCSVTERTLWRDLLDFFEELAHKARVGVVDIDIAYQMFSDDVLRYWFALEDQVKQLRQRGGFDEDLYTELEWLVEAFCLRHPSGRMCFLAALFAGLRRRAVERMRKVVREACEEG